MSKPAGSNEQRRGTRSSVLVVIVCCAIAIILIGGINLFATSRLNIAVRRIDSTIRGTQGPPQGNSRIAFDLPIEDDPILGLPEAPVTFVLFQDYDCVYCTQFYTQCVRPMIHDYVEPGFVKLVIKHYPLERIHEAARTWAGVAECAFRQGVFWTVHDVLLRYDTDDDLPLVTEALGELNIELDALKKCSESNETNTQIDSDIRLGKEIGIRGTPSFVVDNYLYTGARSYLELVQILEERLRGSAITIPLDTAGSTGFGTEENVLFIDIRSQTLFEAGHIPGAINIPSDGASFRDELFGLNTSHQIIVYCAAGNTSKTVVLLMRRTGFENSFSLAEGFSGWRSKGYAVE